MTNDEKLNALRRHIESLEYSRYVAGCISPARYADMLHAKERELGFKTGWVTTISECRYYHNTWHPVTPRPVPPHLRSEECR
jgi:hypothetical protein